MRKYTIIIEIESSANHGDHRNLITTVLRDIIMDISYDRKEIAGMIIDNYSPVGSYYMEDRNPIEKE